MSDGGERWARWSGEDDLWPRVIERRPVGVVADRALTTAQIAEMSSAGARDVALWLHGGRPEPHDWVAGEGSFHATARAIAAARERGLTVVVASLVTRSNARVLIEMPSLLAAWRVSSWVMVWPRAEGELFTSTVARLGLGVPAALAALDRARRIGVDARTVGIPLCTLGPYARYALAGAPRSFGERCGSCAARERCPGVDAAYLARFGEGELRALGEDVAGADDPHLAELAAMLAR